MDFGVVGERVEYVANIIRCETDAIILQSKVQKLINTTINKLVGNNYILSY